MKKGTFKRSMLALCAGLLLSACATSPTGRTQVLLFSPEQLAQMGNDAFASMKSQINIANTPVQNRYVTCVANYITAQVPDSVFSGEWEVVVFDDPQINAFALPGGKIGIYTGILEVAETQDQLAAIIGHEVGHVLAQHGNERASAEMGLSMAQQLGNAALESYGVEQRGTIMAALGVAAQFGGLLPFSRAHESEADIIGLDLMARAGFKPSEAVTLWQNMAKASGSRKTPEWASTHPSPETRIRDLTQAAPRVMPNYRAVNPKPDCR